jgi:hypothetical protein
VKLRIVMMVVALAAPVAASNMAVALRVALDAQPRAFHLLSLPYLFEQTTAEGLCRELGGSGVVDAVLRWDDAASSWVAHGCGSGSSGTVDDTRRVPDPVVYGVAGEWVCTLTVKNSATPGADTETHVIRIANAVSGVPGDADGDGRTDAADLAALIAELADGDGVALADRCRHWPTSDQADVTSDGQITPADLVALVTLL